jgi:hypothetical protein
MMDTSFRGKSGEETQEVIKQMKLTLLLLQQPYGQPFIHSCTCHSLSDSSSSTGFKSATSAMFRFLCFLSVSPVLRPRVSVNTYADAAARLHSIQEYVGAVVPVQYTSSVICHPWRRLLGY